MPIGNCHPMRNEVSSIDIGEVDTFASAIANCVCKQWPSLGQSLVMDLMHIHSMKVLPLDIFCQISC